jgi:ERCC4-type nuclease
MPRMRRPAGAPQPPPPPPFTIIIDVQEKRPYRFAGSTAATQTASLPTGDYSILGCEALVAIERKSLSDAYATFSRERERFKRELQRLAAMDYACIMLEFSPADALEPPAWCMKVQPATVLKSLIRWQVEYGVHVCFAGTREIAERLTYRLLEYWWRVRGCGLVAKQIFR